jgi:hypothetical protein
LRAKDTADSSNHILRTVAEGAQRDESLRPDVQVVLRIVRPIRAQTGRRGKHALRMLIGTAVRSTTTNAPLERMMPAVHAYRAKRR